VYNSTTTSSSTTTTTNTIATTTATTTNTDVSNSKNNDDDNKNDTNNNTSLSTLYDGNFTPSVSNKQSHSITHLHSEAPIFDNISKNNKTKVPIDTHLHIKCLIKTKASSSSFSRPSSSSQPSSSSSSLSNDSYNMITTIQIKWIDQSTIIAKMYSYETIGDLKSYIIQHFTSSLSTVAANKASNNLEFEIRSAYPSKVLGSFLSLQEAGLIPNGTVHARKII